MPSTVLAGRQWPPSPSVEDEAESLAHELPGDPTELKKADDSTSGDGPADQYPKPLTIDVPETSPIPGECCESLVGSSLISKSSDESFMPSTPPPLYRTRSDSYSLQTSPTPTRDIQNRVQSAAEDYYKESSHGHRGQVRTERSPEFQERIVPRQHLGRHFSEGDKQIYTHTKNHQRAECHSEDDVRSPSHYAAVKNKGTSSGEDSPVRKKKVNFLLPGDAEGSSVRREPKYESGSRRPRSLYLENTPDFDFDAREDRPSHRGFHSLSQGRDEYCSPPRGLRPRRASDAYPAYEASSSRSPKMSPLMLEDQLSTQAQSPRYNSPPDYFGDFFSRDSNELRIRRPRQGSLHEGPLHVTDLSPVRRQGPFYTPPLLPADYEAAKYSSQRDPPSPTKELRAAPTMTRARSSTVPSQELVLRDPEPHAPSTLSLDPCPRPIPMAGHYDWYTIIGLTHLDICPSCMKQIGGSRFRDLFVPSLPKPVGTKTRCSFSLPWTRLAWVQTMKFQLDHLDLLYQVTLAPPGNIPCPGRVPSIQSWYRLADPETGLTLPDFNACSACFRKLQALIPSLRNVFRSGPLVQERICDLRADSPRFVQYLDLLDEAVTRSRQEGSGYLNMRNFIKYAKRKSSLYDCPRDHLIVGGWHYMSELPEFTICEDCFDDVVYPLSKTQIGKLISRGLQPHPSGREHGGTCQLYSPRMRAMFHEAVKHDDFLFLKETVLRRYDAEISFRERKKILLEDTARGIDRDTELRKNAEEWKRYE